MKKFMRRGMLLAVVMAVLVGISVSVSARGVYGPCGDSSQFSLDYDTGLLEISGTGWAESNWSYYCDKVKTAVVQPGITELRTSGDFTHGIFRRQYNMTSVRLPGYMTDLGEGTFSSCTALQTVTIPYGITVLREATFMSCEGLTSVVLPQTLTCIEDAVFAGCDSLTDIYFKGSQQQWDALQISDTMNDELFDATVHCVGADSPQTGWIKMSDSWYYRTDAGIYSGWLQQGNEWYYLDVDAKYMVTGWAEINGKRYYMNKDGVMQTGWLTQEKNTYYLNSDGSMHTGWLQMDGNWYYFKKDGTMAKGNIVLDKKMNCFDYVSGIWHGYAETGFQAEWDGDAVYYILHDGSICTGWKNVQGDWYYFDGSGVMQTGWLELNGQKYYLRDDGRMVTGWLDLSQGYDVARYYFRDDGSMCVGWLKLGSDWYYFHADGLMAYRDTKIDGKWYFFLTDEENYGKMATGWVVDQPFSYLSNTVIYCAGSDGVMYSGWKMLDGHWHYFYQNGRMAREVYIDEYYLDGSGKLAFTASKYPVCEYHTGCTKAQAEQADAIAKGIAQEALKNGGNTDYDRIRYAVDKLHGYYVNADFGLKGEGRANSIYGVFVDGKSTYRSNTLAMARVLDFMEIDWQMSGGIYPCLYFKMDGEYGYGAPMVMDPSVGIAVGPKVGFGNHVDVWPYWYDYENQTHRDTPGTWVKTGGNWYYRDAKGKNITGMHRIGGKWYYLKANGVMATGWTNISGSWYYFKTNGDMYTGWLKDGGSWYYLQQDGPMATGVFKATGDYYYADKNGRMITGWAQVDGAWRYAESSGALVRGAAKIGGIRYYFDETGAMGVGWVRSTDGKWYYAASSGALTTGWKNLGGKSYYFYKDGHMASETFIDNYFVNKDGAWEHTVAVKPDHKYYKHLTAEQGAQADAIAKAIAQDALANGGTTDREKIAYASQRVMEYLEKGTYGNDADYHYRSPYGVFVSGRWTCAGATRALGRVLDFMGYTWYHAGEDQWDHQWVCVKMDGEYGSVDPQLGAQGCSYGNLRNNDYDPFA